MEAMVYRQSRVRQCSWRASWANREINKLNWESVIYLKTHVKNWVRLGGQKLTFRKLKLKDIKKNKFHSSHNPKCGSLEHQDLEEVV